MSKHKNPQDTQYTSIGGQAVIEGVMMRSPHYIAIAIRRADKKIVLKDYSLKFSFWTGWGEKFPFLKKPFLRGIVTLIESMAMGIQSLNYSAQIAEPELAGKNDTAKSKQNIMILSTMAVAFLMGIGLFVIAPHLLTVWVGNLGLFTGDLSSPIFHLVDGVIKLIFIITYVYLISLMKDIFRVFQYHGAEHKSIYTFEKGESLTIENAKKFTTLHPRCGTSFLLFLVLISVVLFSAILGPINQQFLAGEPISPILRHALMIGLKILLVFPVASLSYEFIRYSAKKTENPVFKVLILPGLLVQKLTTREPEADQLEIALVSLRRVLYLEKNPESFSETEIIIDSVDSFQGIQPVIATVTEFL